ncbi:MAG: flagellar motor protein MotB [Thermacetogeniaceae bacterium]
MRPKRKAKAANSERWLLTYSDMITLLMIFFIMMYVISNVNTQKFQALARVLGSAFGTSNILDNGNAILPEDVSNNGPISSDTSQLAMLKKQIDQQVAEAGFGGKVTVSVEQRGLVVSIQDTILFVSGSASLTPEAGSIITKIGMTLKPLPNFIRIEGHTDNMPIHNQQFPSNWELSVARATNVVQELITQCGISPGRLSATGYGEYRPVAANDTDEHRQINRRVDILILNGTFNPVEPQA